MSTYFILKFSEVAHATNCQKMYDNTKEFLYYSIIMASFITTDEQLQ